MVTTVSITSISPKDDFNFQLKSLFQWNKELAEIIINDDYPPLLLNNEGKIIEGVEIYLVAKIFLGKEMIKVKCRHQPLNPFLNRGTIVLAA
jgi:hypothetical protein